MPALSSFRSVRLSVARQLEEGTWDGPVAAVLSRAWGAVGARSLARPLVWRDGLSVVCVGGATLGGSGKTPLAIACARELAANGARVAFVAHGYRAKPGGPRVVSGEDDVRAVGDEAIVAARALAGVATVVVAPARQAALDLAATRAEVIVLDGVLQTAPRRASLALLALDGASPWGAGNVVPRGDLRAPPRALLAACDRAVLVRDGDREGGEAPDELARDDARAFAAPAAPPSWAAHVRSDGVFASGELLPWNALAPLRIGLFAALARPVRLLAALARRGIVPHRVIRAPDHGPRPNALSAGLFDRSVQLWIASPKCAVHLRAAGIAHATIAHEVELGASLREALRCVYPGPHLHAPAHCPSLTP